jgi:hypothetical protein
LVTSTCRAWWRQHPLTLPEKFNNKLFAKHFML